MTTRDRDRVTRAALDRFGREHYRLVLFVRYAPRVVPWVLAAAAGVVVALLATKGARYALQLVGSVPLVAIAAAVALALLVLLLAAIGRRLSSPRARARRLTRRAYR